MAVATSYDTSLRYGAQTPFSDQLNFKWEGGSWQYDAFHNSLITVGNGGVKPLKARFTIFYNGGASTYNLEQSLQPDENMLIDVGKLIQHQVPDTDGKTLPTDLATGSYEFQDLTDQGVGGLFEGKVIYDKQNGHVAYGCAHCCGYTNGTWMGSDPLTLAVGNSLLGSVYSTDSCSSTDVPVTSSFRGNWSTGEPSIVTVDSLGRHTGIDIGSTSSYTSGTLSMQVARFCSMHVQSPMGAANVFSLSCTAVSRGQTTTCTVSGVPTGSTFSDWRFADGTNTVSSSNSAPTWTGIAVISGTISVKANFPDGSTSTANASLTVGARNWHTTTASPQEVANGTFTILPVPPSNTGIDSGLGRFSSAETLEGTAAPTVINDSGPNSGYVYLPSIPTVSTSFQYEINPDLENTGSTFFSKQTGTFSQANSQGTILGSTLLFQTQRHEYNHPVQSHWGEWATAIASNNVGDGLESLVLGPGRTQNDYNLAAEQLYKNDFHLWDVAVAVEPFEVNVDAVGNFLGNICYPDYTGCQ